MSFLDTKVRDTGERARTLLLLLLFLWWLLLRLLLVDNEDDDDDDEDDDDDDDDAAATPFIPPFTTAPFTGDFAGVPIVNTVATTGTVTEGSLP